MADLPYWARSYIARHLPTVRNEDILVVSRRIFIANGDGVSILARVGFLGRKRHWQVASGEKGQATLPEWARTYVDRRLPGYDIEGAAHLTRKLVLLRTTNGTILVMRRRGAIEHHVKRFPPIALRVEEKDVKYRSQREEAATMLGLPAPPPPPPPTPKYAVEEPKALRDPAQAYNGDVHKVSDVVGIGLIQAQRLHDLGVFDTHDLCRANPESFAAALGVDVDTFRRWQAMAELMKIKGVGAHYAEALVQAGVTGIADLKARTPQSILAGFQAYLQKRGKSPATDLSETRIVSFQEAAKLLRRRTVAMLYPVEPDSVGAEEDVEVAQDRPDPNRKLTPWGTPVKKNTQTAMATEAQYAPEHKYVHEKKRPAPLEPAIDLATGKVEVVGAPKPRVRPTMVASSVTLPMPNPLAHLQAPAPAAAPSPTGPKTRSVVWEDLNRPDAPSAVPAKAAGTVQQNAAFKVRQDGPKMPLVVDNTEDELAPAGPELEVKKDVAPKKSKFWMDDL